MEENFHIENRQKLLFMANELHKRGYGNLRVFPSISPSGIHWRCEFYDQNTKKDFIASNWIYALEKKNVKGEIDLTVEELADVFEIENTEFLAICKDENKAYEIWYYEMLQKLEKGELPYAYADWEILEGFWETTKGNKIKKFVR